MFKGDDEMMKFIKKYILIALMIISFVSIIVILVLLGINIRTGMTGNQATVYAGFLGLIGGVIGAMSAFVVAQIQLTNQFIQQQEILKTQFEQQQEILKTQFEMQDIVNKEKMKMEIEIENIQSAMRVVSEIKTLIVECYPAAKGIANYLEENSTYSLGYFNENIQNYIKRSEIISSKINDFIMYKYFYDETRFKEFHSKKLITQFKGCNDIFFEIYSKHEGDIVKASSLLNNINSDCEKELDYLNSTLKEIMNN